MSTLDLEVNIVPQSGKTACYTVQFAYDELEEITQYLAERFPNGWRVDPEDSGHGWEGLAVQELSLKDMFAVATLAEELEDAASVSDGDGMAFLAWLAEHNRSPRELLTEGLPSVLADFQAAYQGVFADYEAYAMYREEDLLHTAPYLMEFVNWDALGRWYATDDTVHRLSDGRLAIFTTKTS